MKDTPDFIVSEKKNSTDTVTTTTMHVKENFIGSDTKCAYKTDRWQLKPSRIFERDFIIGIRKEILKEFKKALQK